MTAPSYMQIQQCTPSRCVDGPRINIIERVDYTYTFHVNKQHGMALMFQVVKREPRGYYQLSI